MILITLVIKSNVYGVLKLISTRSFIAALPSRVCKRLPSIWDLSFSLSTNEIAFSRAGTSFFPKRKIISLSPLNAPAQWTKLLCFSAVLLTSTRLTVASFWIFVNAAFSKKNQLCIFWFGETSYLKCPFKWRDVVFVKFEDHLGFTRGNIVSISVKKWPRTISTQEHWVLESIEYYRVNIHPMVSRWNHWRLHLIKVTTDEILTISIVC